MGGFVSLIAAFLLFVQAAPAQNTDLVFEELLLPGGSLGNRVTSIVQDDRGYIWFGSWSGIHRYDGYEFKTYTHEGPDSLRLPARWVEAVALDQEGLLWIGTYGGGLARFDPSSQTFTHYRRKEDDPRSLSSDSVSVLLVDRSNMLWVGTLHGGLNRYDPATDSFTRFTHDPGDPQSLSDNQIRAIYEDRQGVLWIGTNSMFDAPDGMGGLNRFDRESGSFTRYLAHPADPDRLIDRHVESIYEDSRGVLWVGTAGDGLHTFDRSTGRFTRHLRDPANPTVLAKPHVEGGTATAVAFVEEDSQGRIWIGAFGGGLGLYQPGSGLYTMIRRPEGTESDIQTAWQLYESRDGALWLTTLNEVYRVGPSLSDLPVEAHRPAEGALTRAIHKDSDDVIWVGTGRGLVRQRPGRQPEFYMLDGSFWDIEEDPFGDLWMLGVRGDSTYLFKHDRIRDDFHELSLGDVSDLGIPSSTSLLPGRGGTLLIGGRGGIRVLSSGQRECLSPNRPPCRFDWLVPNPGGSHASNFAAGLAFDNEGRLLVGTLAGLYRMGELDRSFERYVPIAGDPASLSDSVVTAIHTDSRGRTWIGTMRGGLNLLVDDESGVGFTRFTTANSELPGDLVSGIVEDENGNLWLHGGRAISRYDPEANRFKNYEVPFGPSFFSASMVWAPAFQAGDGELFFGGSAGYTRFHPGRLIVSAVPPEITLTDFKILNRSVRPGPGQPLRKPIWKTAAVTLPHDQNAFSLDFVGFHYLLPEAIRYSYILEGWDRDWRTASSLRTASFAGVPAGSYTFRLKASNAEGVWSEEKALQVTILPPWWRTWWAYAAYALFFVAGVFSVDRVQRRRLLRKERDKAREREIEQAREIERAFTELQATQQQLIQSEKMASLGQLTAGIAHEIKNPLNFINNFAALTGELTDELEEEIRRRTGILEDGEEIEAILRDLRTNASKIQEHGRRADGIVKSMLLHSRGSSGERQATDLNDLLDEYVNLAYHGMRAQDSDFNVEIVRDFDDSVGRVSVVPQEIGRVFINLLNNAFYAVHERSAGQDGTYAPRVTVTTQGRDGQVDVRIEDNGTGIPKSRQDRIFEPFFTTKPTGSGTGLGLSMSYDIVTHLHGGSIEVDSEEGLGTVFVVSLPVRPDLRAT